MDRASAVMEGRVPAACGAGACEQKKKEKNHSTKNIQSARITLHCKTSKDIPVGEQGERELSLVLALVVV